MTQRRTLNKRLVDYVKRPAKRRTPTVKETDLLLRFHVTLIEDPSDSGYSVGCPTFPGCWSQGSTKDEALGKMAVAIREYLALTDTELFWSEGSGP